MKNLQYLATDIFKVQNSLSTPKIMDNGFNFQENKSYNLRRGKHLASRNMHTAHFGTDTMTISSSGLNLYVETNISLAISNCQCRLCKILLKDLGFVEV